MFPITILSFNLPSEPNKSDKAFCLRQLKENSWSVEYQNIETGEYISSQHFQTEPEARAIFMMEMQNNLERYNLYMSKFFQYKHFVQTQKRNK